MSILREYGRNIQLACDICGAEFDEPRDQSQFMQMLNDAKAEGWWVAKTRHGYKHHCPDKEGHVALVAARLKG